MKVLVISGFLGSGKTTFIRTLVQKTKRKFCILENEYAGSTADETLLQQEDDVQVQALSEGCICCTMRNSFSNKLMNILAIYEPDFLVVESSGVGYLSKILSNIQCIEHSNLRLLEPITIVDARRVSDEEALQEPLCLDQISHAHTVVVSKCETWDDAARQHAEEALRQINPHAQILAHPYQELSPTWFDSLLEHYYGGEPVEEHEAPEEAWESLTLNNVLPCELSCVLALLQDAVRGRYGYVVRAKGFLRIDSLWAYCDISEGRYSVQFTDPPTPATSNMVFIGKALKRGRIRSNFTQRPSV